MVNRNFPVRPVLAVLLAAAALAGLLPALARAQMSDPRYLAGTYLGGTGTDRGRNVGLDAQGNIYLVGETFSSTFMGQTINRPGESDIFIAKLSPDARQLLGLFTIGGVGSDTVGGAAVTPQGEVVVAVNTDDPSFPTKNPLNPTIVQRNPGVVLKVNAALGGLVFSTFTDFTIRENPDLGKGSPGTKTETEVVEANGDLHHQVANTTSVETDAVLDHPTALHPTNRVLDPYPSASQGLVCRLLLLG